MRSYEVARKYFSILELACWSLIVVSGFLFVLALLTSAQIGRNFGGGPTVIALLYSVGPSLALGLVGLVGLVLCQAGRAGVDSAEYAQQSLKIARDQLRIAEAALRQSVLVEKGYANLLAAKGGDAAGVSSASATATSPTGYAALGSGGERSTLPATPHSETIEYKGKVIQTNGLQYSFARLNFDTREAVERYIDQLGVTPTVPRLDGLTRS
ncbi:MAG: hypothetical protein AAGE18_05360 [Pseudomonadota bacterium]